MSSEIGAWPYQHGVAPVRQRTCVSCHSRVGYKQQVSRLQQQRYRPSRAWSRAAAPCPPSSQQGSGASQGPEQGDASQGAQGQGGASLGTCGQGDAGQGARSKESSQAEGGRPVRLWILHSDQPLQDCKCDILEIRLQGEFRGLSSKRGTSPKSPFLDKSSSEPLAELAAMMVILSHTACLCVRFRPGSKGILQNGLLYDGACRKWPRRQDQRAAATTTQHAEPLGRGRVRSNFCWALLRLGHGDPGSCSQSVTCIWVVVAWFPFIRSEIYN
jgi:hypothetical protein